MKIQYSQWVLECMKSLKIRKNGLILDLACGKGRNSLFLAHLGFKVIAIDNNEQSLNSFAHDNISKFNIDVENKNNWPLLNKKFDLILTINFLNRDIFNNIIDSLKENGFLIYETFSAGQEKIGSPRRKDFLLKKGELLTLTKKLIPICYESVNTSSLNSKYIKQRILCKNV